MPKIPLASEAASTHVRAELAFLAPPGDDGFRIELASGLGAADRPPADTLPGTLGLHGFHHVCLTVADMDAVSDVLRARDVTVPAGPIEFTEIGKRAAFFTDP